MAGVLRGFSFSTATTIQYLKNSSNNKSTAFLVVGLEKVVYREGNCQEDQNYEPAQLNTLLERFYAEIKNKHG